MRVNKLHILFESPFVFFKYISEVLPIFFDYFANILKI
ncbi:hypothetical protein SHAL103562_12390 [Shewanella algae]